MEVSFANPKGEVFKRVSAVSIGFNPKGIVSSSPRLARQRLPWVIANQIINRNAVVVNIVRDGRTGMAATALRLEFFLRTLTRNSGLWAGIPLGFSDDTMSPQQPQTSPRGMEIAKKSGLEFLPPPGA
jgi:hypothetical protein